MSDNLFNISSKSKSLKKYVEGTMKSMTADNNLVITLRVLLIILMFVLLFLKVPNVICVSLDNLFVRIFLLLMLIVLTFLDPISAILLISVYCMIFYQREQNRYQMQRLNNHEESFINAGPQIMDEMNMTPQITSEMDETNEMNEMNEMKEHFHDKQSRNTMNNMNDIQNNVVGDEDSMNTEVRTWVNESGPQGMSQPSGFPLESESELIESDRLSPF